MPDTDTDEHTVQTRYERVWNALIKAETSKKPMVYVRRADMDKVMRVLAAVKADYETKFCYMPEATKKAWRKFVKGGE